MRVLYFSDNGSDHNRRFLQKIALEGYEVFFLDITGSRPHFEMPAGVTQLRPVLTISQPLDPRSAEAFLPELESFLQKLQPDILHAGPVPTCGYLAALTQFHPRIVMSWGSDLLLHVRNSAAWERATRYALRGADGFVCDCKTVREAALRYANLENIAEFPWGVEAGRFSRIGKKMTYCRQTPGTVTFLCTRSWEPLYDIDVLLEAFAEAYSQNSSLRLLLVGHGAMSNFIHEFVVQHNLSSVVQSYSEHNPANMPNWFRSADVYVSCAKSDGTSISLLEGMATGLPVLVSDIPSNREWVTPNENGWLAEVGSVRAFAEGLLHAARQSRDDIEAISARNQLVIMQRADWDKNVVQLMKLYETVVESRQACIRQ
ncbi:MAG TPA: glycosyltransferase family 4 protein [Terriglobales bacterium]|jgi:glycosyltransferase involved in cell wall biosynthesis